MNISSSIIEGINTWQVVLLLANILLTAFSQIIIKSGLSHPKYSFFPFVNNRILLGYILLFVVTLINVYVLQYVSFKIFTAFISLTYPLVVILSCIFLKETLEKQKIFATICIVAGIGLFSF